MFRSEEIIGLTVLESRLDARAQPVDSVRTHPMSLESLV